MTADLVKSDPQAALPVSVYLARLAPSGRRTMRVGLDRTAQILTDGKIRADGFPWHQLRYEHVQAVRARLAEAVAPATANLWLSAVKGVLKEAWKLGLLPAEDYHRAVAVGAVRGTRPQRGRQVGDGELRALFRTCGTDPVGLRDQAILAVLFGCGLRRQELCRLMLKDYDSPTLLHVIGKQNKYRPVPLAVWVRGVLRAWLEHRGERPGPLFFPLDRRGFPLRAPGSTEPRPLAPETVYAMVRDRAAQAGLAKISPHDFRRTVISGMLGLVDIATVQRFVGHANIATTARYDRRGQEAVEAAVATILDPTKREAK
jgi:integrase